LILLVSCPSAFQAHPKHVYNASVTLDRNLQKPWMPNGGRQYRLTDVSGDVLTKILACSGSLTFSLESPC
jgi:hypothetical protein